MNVVVAIKHVPSTADELPLNDEGTNLNFDDVEFVLNEFDEHAIEQAVLVKEAVGGEVTVIGVDLIGELDGVLHTALAKGADKVAKVVGDIEPPVNTHTQARWLADAIAEMKPDLVFVGVQAADDLDGQMGPILAAYLDWPYVGVVTGVKPADGTVIVHKEYPGGVMAEFTVSLPAVIGVQAAEKPPRYAPISKIRQVAKTATITELETASAPTYTGCTIRQMAKPVAAGRATMLKGNAAEVSRQIIALLKERGLL